HLAERRLYLAEPTRILAADLLPDGAIGPIEVLYADLPSGGQHPNRTLGVGPDGQLYVSVGSTCNACAEPDEEHATLLVTDPGGGGRSIFARGLRNTLGFDWHPDTGQMWGMDNGTDNRGDEQPPEELNLLLAGEHYGWPWVYGARQPDPMMDEPPGTTKEAFAAETAPPALTYPAHNAPIDFVFYDGAALPPEYRGDAFVAMRGSWNRDPPTGYKVVRVRFQDGWPVGFEDFLTGFLLPGGEQHFGRLAGLTIAADGALLVSDDTNGVIYRVARAR
ncbi:MAG TPA: PQQ-dependent sugar dehydrogenase, partial [Candidatus Nanopelagicales bacterium]|nr:PQQ-dependent sugar dehydrogenase [Candidatus Nanopelagicales bacterium]